MGKNQLEVGSSSIFFWLKVCHYLNINGPHVVKAAILKLTSFSQSNKQELSVSHLKLQRAGRLMEELDMILWVLGHIFYLKTYSVSSKVNSHVSTQIIL